MKRALGSFLLWTFTITGLCWGGLAILGHWGVLTLAHPAGVVLHLLGGFGPTVGGLWVFCRGGGRLRQVPRLVFVPRRGTWWVVLLFCLAEGASQQTIPFGWFAVLAVLQSFWYGALFRRTRWVFGCNLAHGLTNTLLSLFVIQVNGLLAAGCLLLLAASLVLWYRTPWEAALGEGEKGKRTGRM